MSVVITTPKKSLFFMSATSIDATSRLESHVNEDKKNKRKKEPCNRSDVSRSFSARQRIRQQVLTERNAKPVAEQRYNVEMQREDVANRFVVAPVLRVTPERVARVYIVRHVKKRDELSPGGRERTACKR